MNNTAGERRSRPILGTSHRRLYDVFMMNASAPTTPAPPPPSRPRARLRRLTINIPEAVFRQLEDERASCATAARPNPTITEVVCAKLARPLHPDARASRGL